MKGTVILLFILCSGFMGMIFSFSLQKRRRELESFRYAMGLLEAEMVYARNPLWLCFFNVSKRLKGVPAKIFLGIGEGLKHNTYATAELCFLGEMERFRDFLSISSRDYEEMLQFGANLGTTNDRREEEKIKSTVETLTFSLTEAKDREKKWQRLSSFGGWFIGIVVGLLLI